MLTGIIALTAINALLWLALQIPGVDFQANFLANLLSDSIVAIFFGIWLIKFTELIKKPNLRIVVKQNGQYGNRIVATKNGDQLKFIFTVAIHNTGNKTVKAGEGYWHLYFPGAAEVFNLGATAQIVDQNHIRDTVALPIFPKSFLDVGPEFRGVIKFSPQDKDKQFEVRYFLDTDYGRFPKAAKVDQKTGFVLYENMGVIPIT